MDVRSIISERPLRADARRNRERILDAARDLFAQGGQATQMDDIARLAGVGVGTVYRHFPTKDVLVGELVRLKFERHAERARHWSAAVADGWDAFEGFVRECVDEMSHDASQRRMMWMADAAAFEYAADARVELSRAVGEMIDRAKGVGRIRPDFTVEDMPTVMCAIGSVMSASSEQGAQHERLVDLLLDSLRRG